MPMRRDILPHLPPPATWRAAQARARACGLWLDLTMDGVYHVYRLHDNREHAMCATFADALACVGAGRVREKAA